jgi:hypothetical protein
MSDGEAINFQELPFICPYCGRATVVESPMETIEIGRADCEREFLIGNDVPGPLPQ